MKAIVYHRYGSPDVLQIEERPKPTPSDDEVLIRVHATTVTSGDTRVRALEMPRGFKLLSRLFLGFSAPRQTVLGTELSGVIEAIGKDVTRFAIGDRVFAFCGASMGCYVEYLCMPEGGLIALAPTSLALEDAAALSFGGTTVLEFFRRAKIEAGDDVLINGASGGVGTAAVQLAKHFGAHVTAVCSAANIELVKSIGADEVIDYTAQDFTKNGKTYDMIVDTVGTAPFARSRSSLKDDGRLLLVLGDLPAMLHAPWVALTSRKRVIAGPATGRSEDLQLLAKLAQDGKFRPVIDRRFTFDQMADAHRLVDSGRKRGNVLVVWNAE